MSNHINSYINQQVNKAKLVALDTTEVDQNAAVGRNTRLDLKARVGRQHFALLRGYLEGIELKTLAQRYLHADGTATADLRIVKRILQWTIDELIVLARRQGKFAFAHAIDIEPSRLQATTGEATPSLDDFRNERDPDGFYNETELLELFRDEYPAGNNRKEKRNARLRERQNEALRWLETQVSADPQMDDAIAGWYPDALATRLNAVGIVTIKELVAWINQRGTRWFVSIPKIGKEAAHRIQTWLEMNQGSLKYTFGRQVFVKRSELNPQDLPQRESIEGIVPLEYFKARPQLDGTSGTNRAPANRYDVNNDADALRLWLASCSHTSNSTQLSYRREAERFLIWCVIERQKPLSSADADDCQAYRQFLNDLGRVSLEQWKSSYRTHSSQWLGRRGTSRASEAWRPFDGLTPAHSLHDPSPSKAAAQNSDNLHAVGALTLSSQRQAIIILKNLFSWLTNIRYLESNPFENIKPLLEQRPQIKIDNSFSFNEWNAVLRVLESRPKDAHYFRLRFVLIFLYGTGLRLSELANAKAGDLQSICLPENGVPRTGYLLKVAGRREKNRLVPIPDRLIHELATYMAHRGFASLDTIPSDTHMIGRLTDMPVSVTTALQKRKVDLKVDKLSARNLYQILKDFFAQAHAALCPDEPESAAHILRASTHWLRHTCGVHAIANGVNVDIIRSTFGHESLATTDMYIKREAASQLSAMDTFLSRSMKLSD